MEEVTSFHGMVSWVNRIGDVRELPIEELVKPFSFLKFPLTVIGYSFSGLLDDSTLGSDDILTTNNFLKITASQTQRVLQDVPLHGANCAFLGSYFYVIQRRSDC